VKLANAFQLVGAVHGITIGHRVVRQPNGRDQVCKPWFAKWYENGKERSRSLKTTNKQAAIRLGMDLDKQLSSGLGLARRAISMEELTTSFLDSKRGERRAFKTLEKYSYVLAEFTQQLAEDASANAARLTADHFWAYSNFLIKKEDAEGTWYDKLVIVKMLGRWGEQHGKLARNPFKTCKVPEPAPTKQPCFTPEQVASLIAAAEGQMKAIVTVLMYTGIRFGELRDLEWANINLSVPAITIEKGGSGATTKGRRSRVIPLHPEVVAVLKDLPRRGDRVFYQEASEAYPHGNNPLDERRLLRSFKRLCKRAGLADPDQFNLHTCRHAFASMLAPNVSERYGLELMGHKESDVLRRYVTLYDQDLSRAINSIKVPAPPPSNPNTNSDGTNGR
jgi:integrase